MARLASQRTDSGSPLEHPPDRLVPGLRAAAEARFGPAEPASANAASSIAVPFSSYQSTPSLGQRGRAPARRAACSSAATKSSAGFLGRDLDPEVSFSS